MSGYPDSHLSRTIGTGRRRYLVALIPFLVLLLWFVYLWSVSGVLTTKEKYPGGAIQAEGYLKRGLLGGYTRHGKWTTYHPNGQPSGEGTYQLGKKLDDWAYWDEEGRPTTAPPPDINENSPALR